MQAMIDGPAGARTSPQALTERLLSGALADLGWSAADLAFRARLPLAVVETVLIDGHLNFMGARCRATLRAVREAAGVSFRVEPELASQPETEFPYSAPKLQVAGVQAANPPEAEAPGGS